MRSDCGGGEEGQRRGFARYRVRMRMRRVVRRKKRRVVVVVVRAGFLFVGLELGLGFQVGAIVGGGCGVGIVRG